MGRVTQQPWFKFYEEGVRQELQIPDISLLEAYKQSVDKYAERTALLFNGRTWTYLQMDTAVERLARALYKEGLRAGDRIAIYMPNSANWVITFFAVMRLGAIVVQTNPLYTEDELRIQMIDSGAVAIVSIAQLLPRILAVQAQTNLNLVLIDTFGQELEVPGALVLHRVLEESSLAQVDLPTPQIEPEHLAVLQYTGGTTGVSKGVMLTHRNLVTNALQIWEWVKTGNEEAIERVLAVLPLFHIYALTTCMNVPLINGGMMIILPKFDIAAVMQHINDYQPTIFPGAPTMYVAIIHHPRIKQYNVSSIRVCISGSAPLPAEVAVRFRELTGGRLVEGYGLSESSPVTHINPVYHARVGAIGVPVSGTDAKIVDLATGEITLEPGEVGELAVKGGQVMLGYWQRPADTKTVLKDGWLYTGDIARMDEDGFFYIVDRKKDMIISGGYNVYPRDVEEVLYQHPAVREVVCAGVPHEYWGEMVKAYVVLKAGQCATEDNLKNYCSEKLAAYKVPKRIEIRESLPKTAVGKVLRRFLIEEEKKNRRMPAR